MCRFFWVIGGFIDSIKAVLLGRNSEEASVIFEPFNIPAKTFKSRRCKVVNEGISLLEPL